MATITSRDNPRIKNARRVRDGKIRDSIFIEGLRLAEEFLRSQHPVQECFFTEHLAASPRGKAVLDLIAKEKMLEVSESVFSTLADTKHSQGIVIIGEKPQLKTDFFAEISKKNLSFPHIVLLHQINNPSNLGAILRTCEAVGCSQVIITKNSADVFTPKCLRSAMGAAFRLFFWTNADFDQAVFSAKENDYLTICADIKARQTLWEVNWEIPRLIIFGSEAHGLTDKEILQTEEGFVIPMENGVESLNLAVSCGIVLYAAKNI